nr:glycosyltransferase domain-containing protein [Ochrobactrum sp. Marseille-Q0166]
MGNFDELASIPTVELGVDYYCFTDQPISVPQPYKNRVTPYVDPNPRKTARFVKTHPHYFFPDYDVVVWVDANVVPLKGILPYVEIVVESGADIGVIRHPVRSGYIEEANECKRIGSDDIEILDQQVELYQNIGVKNENLVETNILISRPLRRNVQKFFDHWWSEINTRSIRDQISLRYAIMKSGVKEIEIFEPGISTRDEGNFIHFAYDVKGRSRIVDFVMQTARD